MTRRTPTNRPKTLPGRVCALQAQGDQWRAALVRLTPSPALERAESFLRADVASVAAFIDRNKVDAVVVVVPSGSIVCRTVPAAPPTGSIEQVTAALGLMAEAQLGSTTAPHRRAAGVIRLAGDAAPVVVALGWSGEWPEYVALEQAVRAPIVCVPEPLALGSLVRAAEGSSVALYADRVSGSVAIIAGGKEKSVIRTMREDPDDKAEWENALRRAVAAASTTAGSKSAPLTRLDRKFGLSIQGSSGEAQGGWSLAAVAGVPVDQSWLDHYGLALGAALALSRSEDSSAPLMGMSHDEPVPQKSVPVVAAEFFNSRSRAITAVAACAVLALLWPLGVAAARYKLLQDHLKASEIDEEKVQSERQLSEFSSLLKDKRWPMTKLLSDLTGSLPLGIILENVDLTIGQRIKVSGSADSAGIISDWRAALNKSRVFDDVQTPQIEASSTPVKFQLSAKVSQPLLIAGNAAAPASTSAASTPASAAADAADPASSAPAAKSEPSTTNSRGNNRGGDRNATRGTDRGGNRNGATGRGNRGSSTDAATSGKADIPAPLSDTDIAAMDRAAATVEWGKRKGAAGRPNVSAEDKQRLLDEAEKLQARRKALEAEGGGGGGS